MPRRPPDSVLSALGVTERDERLYLRLAPLSGSRISTVATQFAMDKEDLVTQLASLQDRGLVELRQGRICVASLSGALAARVAGEAAAATQLRQRLDELSTAIPYLAASLSRPGPGQVADVRAIDGEISSGGDALSLLTALVEQSRGDLLWLRPDAWRMPREPAMARIIAGAVASGRRSRAIYPVRALTEAPDALRARVDGGEEIRFLDDLPTRLIVIGGTHAVLPEPIGFTDEPRLLIRQPAIVASLALLFDSLWVQAATVPELDRGRLNGHDRRFLLRQLAAGAKDEQIARSLGISLRTVRRRVAELLDELHVESRFQAGVEAVRRGLL